MLKLLVPLILLTLIGCDDTSGNNTPHDAGPDGDVTDVIDVVDIEDVLDSDTQDPTPLDDPYQVNLTCSQNMGIVKGNVLSFSAKYPFIYWFGYYWENEEYHYPLYKHNVTTGETTFITELATSAASEQMVMTENGLYWIGSDINNDTGTYFSHFYRLDVESDIVEELTIDYPFSDTYCQEGSTGRVSLFGYDIANNWLYLRCRYRIVEEMSQFNYDFYRLNTMSGERQYLVDGQERWAQEPLTGYEQQNSGHLLMWGRGWEANWTRSQETKLGIWEVNEITPSMILDESYAFQTIGRGGQVSNDNWYYYTQLNSSDLLEVYGKNLVTGEECVAPDTEKHKHGPYPTGKHTPHLIAYNDGSTELSTWSTALQPSYISQLHLWDKESAVTRQVTVYNLQYLFPNFMPNEPEPRYLIYNAMISGYHCIFYKDLVTAGILDQSGHLIPQ